MESTGHPPHVLIIVENLPVPADRRVWQEALTLRDAGYQVSVICPKGKGYERRRECIDGIHIYRHALPEASGALGYLIEYSTALFWELVLSWWILISRGFDVIHACNPPDTIFLVAAPFKLLGKRFIFDHHDIGPEMYQAKFGRSGALHRLMLALERWTFRMADVSIASSVSFRHIAIERGGMPPDKVFVVRSAPCLEQMKILPPVPALKQGRRYLVGYIGVMARQDGVDHLLHAARHIVHAMGRLDTHFILVGAGPDFDRLQDYARRLAIQDYVTFTGWLQGNPLLEVLSTMDVGVSPEPPNDYNDKCTMNKVMEYMAMAKPVVQFDLTEGRHCAGEASLYVRKNDAVDMAQKIVTLLDDDELRQQMGQLGRQRMENQLAWQHQAPELIRAYQHVLGVKGQEAVT
jgi:glycosyltransferase involved in cell wall biosynthesis